MNRRALYAALLSSLAATVWLSFQPDDDTGTPLATRAAQTPSLALAANAGTATAAGTSGTAATSGAPRVAPAWPAPPKARDARPWPIGSDAMVGWSAPAPAPALPPPAARMVDATPAAPSAPAFPYQLIGRLEGDGPPTALLNGPLRTLSVKAQDTIDGQWRVEAVLPTGVSLLWLPGGQKQMLSFRPS